MGQESSMTVAACLSPAWGEVPKLTGLTGTGQGPAADVLTQWGQRGQVFMETIPIQVQPWGFWGAGRRAEGRGAGGEK